MHHSRRPFARSPLSELSECWIWASGGRTCPSTRLSARAFTYLFVPSFRLWDVPVPYLDLVAYRMLLIAAFLLATPLPRSSYGLFLGAWSFEL
ncbi:hypothetical protein LY76DRAFT_191294 [Colletotrichum caudatum]|nr:hypothetical protein LY76DRAFT_191294 [Colletotrichum caudatum]